MKRLFLLIAAASAMMVVACAPKGTTTEAQDTIIVNIAEKGAEISPSMYGIFFEEINHSGDGGLLAEMIENKSFEDLEMPEGYYAEGDRIYTPEMYHHSQQQMVHGDYRWTTEAVPGWVLDGTATMELTKEDPMFESAPNSLKVSVDGQATLTNDGFWGMYLQVGKNYEFRTIVKPSEGSSIAAKLVSENGDVLAEATVEATAGQWNDVNLILTPNATTDKGSLAFAIEGNGTVNFDYVSLLPEDRYEYEGGKLPFRKDVAEMLVGLKPAFVRWPGGCVVEGISLNDRFEWKKTLGDPATRPGIYDTWGYHASYGFGYHEMLCFCESIGAGGMFVCNVGLGCQYRQGDACSEEDIQFYIDDCMDAIEYALGPVDSEWGALRAQAGHPEPLPLKYVEIGNENWGAEYERRYDMFHEAIRAKYPDLILICNNRIGGPGSIKETDMIDPHWYVNPDYFFDNTHLFDNIERSNYTAYVGEYAANSGVGSGNMRAALSEAAFIGGMERNGDFVKMCSYAPLLENSNDRVWPVNLIWVNSSQVLGRSSYYVQKMAADNRPDYNVTVSAYERAQTPAEYDAGKISLGTNGTATEFKDLTVTVDGEVKVIDLGTFDAKKGDWSYADGVLCQTSLEDGTVCTFDGKYEGSYSVDVKFRRTKGIEGCYVGFGMTDDAMNGYRCSVGGWDDTKTAIEKVVSNDGTGTSTADCSLVTGEWQMLHLDVTGGVSVLYIDGQKIVEDEMKEECATFYAAGFDEETSETVIKVVNRSGKVYPLGITLEGASKIARSGKVITLSAERDIEENTFEDTMKISPVESKWNGFGKDFVYNLEPYSYTILRVKTSK